MLQAAGAGVHVHMVVANEALRPAGALCVAALGLPGVRAEAPLSESVAAEITAEVVEVEHVPAGAMRILSWPATGELQYGCRLSSGGWAVSNRLAMATIRLPRRGRAVRAELQPILETMAEGGDFGSFGGELVGGMVGCVDITAAAAALLDVFDAVEARPSPKKRARR